MYENWVPWLEHPSIQQTRVADKCFIVTNIHGKGTLLKNKKCEKH